MSCSDQAVRARHGVRLNPTEAWPIRHPLGPRVESATALIWKVLQVAEQTFRRPNAPEFLPPVYAGVPFVDGQKHTTEVIQQEVAA